jgi:hypothetical protein
MRSTVCGIANHRLTVAVEPVGEPALAVRGKVVAVAAAVVAPATPSSRKVTSMSSLRTTGTVRLGTADSKMDIREEGVVRCAR